MASFKKFYDVNPKDKLGSGTYGDVFLGTRRADNLQVAVKKMLRKNMDATILDMVVGEVQILKELNHPHIVKIYDLYKDYEAYYICLELVTGGELFNRITKKTYYSEVDARNCCKIILSAIKHCHSRHIVHRDLKPENLLMQSDDDDASLKLIDFGFAQYAPEPTLKGICGTAIYMAPEIWKHECYGKSVDMWAVGVITYILLGGYPPFSDETRQQLISQICAGSFEFHYEYWKEVSEEAKDFIRRLLTVNVADRMTVSDAMRHKWVSPMQLVLILASTVLRFVAGNDTRRAIRASFNPRS
jgi:calcium/calmodulin-dependent protein kinase I